MKKETLRTVPRYMTFLSLVLLVASGFLFLTLTDVLGQKRSLDYFEGMSSKAEQSVTTYLEEIERMAKLASYSHSVQEYIFESTPYLRVQAQRAATDLITNIMSSSPSIREIAFYRRDGALFQTNGEYSTLMRAAAEEQELKLRENGEKGFFSQVIYNTFSSFDAHTPYFLFVFPVYSLIEGEFSATPYATCLVLARLEELTNRHIEGVDIPGAVIALLENDRIIYSDRELGSEDAGKLEKASYGGSMILLDGKKSLVYRHSLQNTLWNAEIIAPESALAKDLIPIRRVIIIYIVVGILLQGFLLTVGTRQISAPLLQLVDNIRKIDLKHNIRARIEPAGIEEIDLLSGSINDLLDLLEQIEREQKETSRKLYTASLLREQAQLQYYRSQINPHFLYNTLECISAMARLSGVERIESICVSMAEMFRYSVSDGSEATVRQEVAQAENYYNVIAQRVVNRYHLRIHISEEDYERKIQKMVLQPLLENAVKHGFAGKDAPCNVLIRLDKMPDGGFCLLVADNGMGISPARLKKLNERLNTSNRELAFSASADGGVGLLNIAQRLQLAYGGKSRVELTSRYGFFTCVKLHLPLEES